MTLKALVNRTPKVTASAVWAESNPHMDDMPAGSSHWRVTLRYRGRRLTVPFSQGPAICEDPSAESVLSCLLSDASSADQDFEHWADDLGFDQDSRKAERIYRVVQAQTAKLRRFLGEDFSQFMHAEP